MTEKITNMGSEKMVLRNTVWVFPLVFFAIVAVFSIFYLDSPNENLPLVAKDGIWKDLIQSEKPTTVVLGDLQVLQKNKDTLPQKPQSYLTTSSPLWVKQLTTVFSSIQTDYQIQTTLQFNTEALRTSDLIVVGTQPTLGIFQSYWTPSKIKYNAAQNFFFYEENDSQTPIVFQPKGNTDSFHTDYGYLAKLPGPHSNIIYIISGTRDTGTTQSLKNFTDPSLLSKLEKELVAKFGVLPNYFEVFFEVDGIDGKELNSKVIDFFEIKN